jgi:cell division protein FtsW (lipid II flippase)
VLLAGMVLAFVAGEGGSGPQSDALVGVAYILLLLLFPAFPLAVAYVAIVLCVARRNPDAGRAVAILLPAAATLAAAPAMDHPLLVAALLGMSLACGAAIQLDPRRTLADMEWVWLTELSLAMLVTLFSVVPA